MPSPWQIRAVSISRPLHRRLTQGTWQGHIVGVYQHASNLLGSDNDVVSLVSTRAGDGPLNIVIREEISGLRGLQPGARAFLVGNTLQVGEASIGLGDARVWDPRPDWHHLQTRLPAIRGDLATVRDSARRLAYEPGLLQLIFSSTTSRGSKPQASAAIVGRIRSGAEIIAAGWLSEPARVQEGSALLAGVGAGLTPAGDDFLVGVLLWAWLAHTDTGSLCQAVLRGIGRRTTTLSTAYLKAAACGECGAAWHNLLMGLGRGAETNLTVAINRILSYGSTSGADSLAGFLWIAANT